MKDTQPTYVRTVHDVGRSMGALSCTTDKHTEHTKHSKSGKRSSLIELIIGDRNRPRSVREEAAFDFLPARARADQSAMRTARACSIYPGGEPSTAPLPLYNRSFFP